MKYFQQPRQLALSLAALPRKSSHKVSELNGIIHVHLQFAQNHHTIPLFKEGGHNGVIQKLVKL